MGPFAWTLFESQITNEDPSCVLSNVLFILATGSFTNSLAGFKRLNEGVGLCLREQHTGSRGVLEWQS